MTNEERQLVRETFSQVEKVSEIFALTFYQRLFHMDPTLRPLFRSDIVQQSIKLMQALRMLVESIDRLEEVTTALESLGRRHVSYGVRDEHYDTVGAALLWTFRHVLGERFTPKARQAWTELYASVSETMKRAAAFQSVPAVRLP